MFGKRFRYVPDVLGEINCEKCVLWKECTACDWSECDAPCWRGMGQTPMHFESVDNDNNKTE